MAENSDQAPAVGPILFAYDGSELAELAIAQACRLLAPGREGLVVCVWQPSDVGFVPANERHFDAQNAGEVQDAAEQTAARGAARAKEAGVPSQSVAIESAPTWKGIVKIAEERNVSVIVIGSHRRSGLARQLLGSVASAVVTHAIPPVLVVHEAS